MSDEELACASQAGSSSAFDELVRRYQCRLLQYLAMLTNNSTRAEDLLQETFLRAFQSIRTYRSRWRFSTWIFTIARRCYLKSLRSLPVVPANSIPHEVEYLDDDYERAEFAGVLWTTIRKLVDDDGFTALWMRYVDDASIADIAKVLGRTKSGAKMMLSRLRQKIRPQIKPFFNSQDKSRPCNPDKIAIRSEHRIEAA